MIIILKYLLIFSLMSVTELFWSLYIHNVRDEKLLKAGVYNVGIFLFTSITTIFYVKNTYLLIPAIIGVLTGTIISKYFYKK